MKVFEAKMTDVLSRLQPAQDSTGPAMGKLAKQLIEMAKIDATGLCKDLESSPDGLLDREAEERLEKYGRNSVVHEKKKSVAAEIFDKFKNPLNLLLLVLATISYFTEDVASTIIISIMVLLSVGISFLQEHRSSSAAERLRAMVSTTATVRRKDKREGVPPEITEYFHIRLTPSKAEKKEVPIETIVPGDVIYLSAGDMRRFSG